MGLGHTGSFFAEQPEAGSRLINTLVDSDRVDDSLYKPTSVDLTPAVRFTVVGRKGIAGTMVGLALLAVLSLLWMPRRVHKQGRFGGLRLREPRPVREDQVHRIRGGSSGRARRAWLGFNASEDLVASIAGAAVGANLILLFLDIAWDRQTRDRFVASSAKETLRSRPRPLTDRGQPAGSAGCPRRPLVRRT